MKNLMLLIFLFLSMNIFSKPVFLHCEYEVKEGEKLKKLLEINIEEGMAADLLMGYSWSVNNSEMPMKISPIDIVLGTRDNYQHIVINRETLKTTYARNNKWGGQSYFQRGSCELAQVKKNNKF